MIPDTWQRLPIRRFIRALEAGVSVNGENRARAKDELGVLKVSSVTNGSFEPNEYKAIRADEIARAKVNPKKNRIIFSRANTPGLVGASAFIHQDYPDLYLPDKLWQLEPVSNDLVCMRWLAFYLSSARLRKLFYSLATGSSGSMKNISKGDLLDIVLDVPPLPAQKAIAEILSIWDEAIEKTKRLIKLKDRQLQAYILQAVTNGRFAKVPISKVAFEVSKRNRSLGLERVLSVTNSNGFVLPESYFQKQVASRDLGNYKVVEKSQYAYNPSRINVGSIARLDDWEIGVLSPMYVVFALKEGKINSDFFRFWLLSHEAKSRICMSAQGSVRETVNYSDFSRLVIPLPDLEKQRDIARFLSSCNDEIAVLSRIKAQISLQKRGLMQKLLTGKWRVPLKEEAISG